MYPLRFQPIFQQRIWGGQQLRTVLQKQIPAALAGKPVGESWELADLPAGTVKADSISGDVTADGSFSSVITNGPLAGKTLGQAWAKFGGASGGQFPLLVKFLDAQQDLSVQVHPDAAYCKNHPGSHLKSEAWYIIRAEPGARIHKGLKPGVTKDQFREALRAGEVAPLVQAIRVRAGDCHYLPSGTLHALGAGILAAEVQTPSDTTFRVFDWNRLTPEGKQRALHVEQALECINFEVASSDMRPMSLDVPANPQAVRLAASDCFVIDRLDLRQGIAEPISSGEMRIWIILEGQGVISCDDAGPTAFTRGDTLLLPAGMTNASVKTIAKCVMLETRLPQA